jgi:hypothetical protein
MVGALRAVALVAFAGGAAGVAAGCGPSFQAVYEGDVRFEHCYALDQTTAPVEARKECWRDWLHVYTYGQSSDRIEFAAARFSELSLDPTLPSVDPGTRPKRGHSAAPLPTNAFAPPPNVAGEGAGPGEKGGQGTSGASGGSSGSSGSGGSSASGPTPDGGSGSQHVAQVAARAPGEECTAACADRWNACRRSCTDGACETCDQSYRSCVPACFKEVHQIPRSLR